MPLQLPQGSRFAQPLIEETFSVPPFVSSFEDLVGKIAAQGDRQAILEHFKAYFAGAIGTAHYQSSDEGWAYTDLMRYMGEAGRTPALFIEAFYDACESLRSGGRYDLPDVAFMNEVLRTHGVPFEIRPPQLVRLEAAARVAPPAPPPTLAEGASSIIRHSLQRAEELLAENRPREAVQEMLWILESIATSFRGIALQAGTIQGRYFNEIARELRNASRGTTLDRVVEWCTQLQGYLSSPTGGGVRHGLDLNSGTPISPEEGRLFCNLALSYVTFLMSEHARLSR